MYNLTIHASELSSIVAGYKPNMKKVPPLSKGAQALVKSKVKQHLRQYNMHFSTSATRKGTEKEQEAIDLLNEYRGKNYQKCTTRIKDIVLSGECDIIDLQCYDFKTGEYCQKIIRDIKCPEKWPNMPATWDEVQEYAKKGGYDWQGVAYMYLYDADKFRIDCVFMETDIDEIPSWQNHTQFTVMPNVPLKQRICTWGFDRDYHKEAFMLDRLQKCNEFAQYYYNRIK